MKVSDGCDPAADCRCIAPTSLVDCELIETPCLLPPTYPPATCEGACAYNWIGIYDTYVLLESQCSLVDDCHCTPPSSPPCAADECCLVIVPCVASPSTSTTAYSHCEQICHGEPTTTTTPADATCSTGGCQWAADGTTAWIGPLVNDCPVSCPCESPSRDPLDTCELYAAPCVTPPTTTTTVTPPTTTTTCCPGDMGNHYARYTCDGVDWQISVDCGCPEGFEPYAGCPAALGTCGGFNVGTSGCCLCVASPTTTTTAAPTTTTAPPTTTSSTTTTTIPPTTTSSTTTTTAGDPCPPASDPGCEYHCVAGIWTLVSDTNCPTCLPTLGACSPDGSCLDNPCPG